MSANVRKDLSGTDEVRVDLTPEQKTQPTRDKDAESSELEVQELEQRIAPLKFM